MCPVRLRSIFLVGICAAGAVSCLAQTLPPGAIPLDRRADARRRIVFPEAAERARAAIAALRQGDLRELKRQLSDAEYVVDLSRNGSPDALSKVEHTLAGGLLHYAEGDLRDAYEAGQSLLGSTAATESDKADTHVLLAFTFYRVNVLALAYRHVEAARRLCPDRPVLRPLSAAIQVSLGGVFQPTGPSNDPDGNGKGCVRWWGFISGRAGHPTPAYRQPHTVAWFRNEQDEDFAGAITMDQADDSTADKPHYRLVFRDLDGPPLTLREGIAKLPLLGYSTQLIEFARCFSAASDRSDAARRFDLLRIQMEATWYHEAGLAPLAAEWVKRAGFRSPMLSKEVEEPLKAARSWYWQQVGRYHAGPVPVSPELRIAERDLARCEVLFRSAVVAERELKEARDRVKTLRASGPAPYEVIGYLNQETFPWAGHLHAREPALSNRLPTEAEAAAQRVARPADDVPETLEHMHFAAVTRDDRQFVGSYRLVSRRQEGNERLFMIERVAESQITILEVAIEPPTYEQMRDNVLAWID